jgi:hypothetical protein
MKNLFAALTVLLTVTSASAFFENNNFNPWDNDNNNRWTLNSNGNAEDNGIFAYNSYDFWDPRWYSTEFTNMVNEIDDESDNQYAFNSNSFPAKDTTTK